MNVRRRRTLIKNIGIAAAVLIGAGAVALVLTLGSGGGTAAKPAAGTSRTTSSPGPVGAAPQAAPGPARPGADGRRAGPGSVPDPAAGTDPGSDTAGQRSAPGGPVPPPGKTGGFGLIMPGDGPGEVRFAAAAKSQPGGPETVRPVGVSRYRTVALAPGAQLWITAPIYDGDLPDVVKGTMLTPQRFAAMYHQEDARFGPIRDRAHMFDVRFDSAGRITWIHQIFSP